MDAPKTIMANPVGNPSGQYVNPWPPGHPVEGERVAIFAFEVVAVDGQAEHIRSYHVAPVGQLEDGPEGPARSEPEGISVRWTGRGTGTVVRPADWQRGEYRCEVAPDDQSIG